MSINSENAMQSPRGAVIHLGAGRCSELSNYLEGSPERVLLIEADPQQAEALKAHTSHLPQVQVLRCAVADREGPAVFHRYSLPEANSLRAATGLLSLFPGLKCVQKSPVTTVDVAAIINPLALAPEADNLLVVEVPGEEMALLRALQGSGQLHLFRHLHLHCGREALYEGSEPAATILGWLKKEGFDLREENATVDPERPWWRLHRNDLLLQNRALAQRLTDLETALVAAKAKAQEQELQLQQAKAQAGQQRDEASKQISELKEQLASVSKFRDELAKQAADREAQLRQITQQRDEAVKQLAELKQQVEAAIKARDQQTRLVSEGAEHIKEIDQKLQSAFSTTEQLRKDLERTSNLLNEQEKAAAERDRAAAQSLLEYQKHLDQERSAAGVLRKELDETKKREQALKNEISLLSHNQPLLDQEMVKVEAQIELIKDILIREKAF